MSTPSTDTSKDTMQQRKGSSAVMWVAVAIVLIVIIVAAVGAEAGWFTRASPNPGSHPGTSCTVPASQSINGAGSTFVYPLMYTWTVDYTASAVSYNSVGSGTGISDLAAKSVDFAASDAPLSPAQQATAQNVVEMPESAGAVAIIYNLAGFSALHFNGTVLAGIYLGTITHWNDPAIAALNPTVTLPSSAIIPVFRSDGSGTTFAFTEYLTSHSSAWVAKVGGTGYATSITFPVGAGQHGSGGVASYVASTAGTVGYVDLEYALANGISFGAVQNATGGFVLPSINSTANAIHSRTASLPAATDAKDWYNVSNENAVGANAYPIATFTYLMSYADLSGSFGSAFTLQDAQALVSFWNWTIHQGQSYSGQLYYVPLPPGIVTADQAELSAFTYNGAAVAHC